MSGYEREEILTTPSDNGYNSLSLLESESYDSSVSELYESQFYSDLINENKQLHIQLNTYRCHLEIKDASIQSLKQTITQQNHSHQTEINNKFQFQILQTFNRRPTYKKHNKYTKTLKHRLKILISHLRRSKLKNRQLINKVGTLTELLKNKDLILEGLNASFNYLNSEYMILSAKHLKLSQELIQVEAHSKLLELRLKSKDEEQIVVNKLLNSIRLDLTVLCNQLRRYEESVTSDDEEIDPIFQDGKKIQPQQIQPFLKIQNLEQVSTSYSERSKKLDIDKSIKSTPNSIDLSLGEQDSPYQVDFITSTPKSTKPKDTNQKENNSNESVLRFTSYDLIHELGVCKTFPLTDKQPNNETDLLSETTVWHTAENLELSTKATNEKNDTQSSVIIDIWMDDDILINSDDSKAQTCEESENFKHFTSISPNLTSNFRGFNPIYKPSNTDTDEFETQNKLILCQKCNSSVNDTPSAEKLPKEPNLNAHGMNISEIGIEAKPKSILETDSPGKLFYTPELRDALYNDIINSSSLCKTHTLDFPLYQELKVPEQELISKVGDCPTAVLPNLIDKCIDVFNENSKLIDSLKLRTTVKLPEKELSHNLIFEDSWHQKSLSTTKSINLDTSSSALSDVLPIEPDDILKSEKDDFGTLILNLDNVSDDQKLAHKDSPRPDSKEYFALVDKKLEEISKLCQKNTLKVQCNKQNGCDNASDLILTTNSTQTEIWKSCDEDASEKKGFSSRLSIRRNSDLKVKKNIYKNIMKTLVKLNNELKKRESRLKSKLDSVTEDLHVLNALKVKYEQRFYEIFTFLMNLVKQYQGKVKSLDEHCAPSAWVRGDCKYNGENAMLDIDIYSFEDVLMDLLQIILSKLSNIRSYVTILHMEINSMKDDKYSLQKYNKQLKCALDTSVGHNKNLLSQLTTELNNRELLTNSIMTVFKLDDSTESNQLNQVFQIQCDSINDIKVLVKTLMEDIQQIKSILRIKCCQ